MYKVECIIKREDKGMVSLRRDLLLLIYRLFSLTEGKNLVQNNTVTPPGAETTEASGLNYE